MLKLHKCKKHLTGAVLNTPRGLLCLLLVELTRQYCCLLFVSPASLILKFVPSILDLVFSVYILNVCTHCTICLMHQLLFIGKHDASQHQNHFCYGRMARRSNESCSGWPNQDWCHNGVVSNICCEKDTCLWDLLYFCSILSL